MSRKQKRAIAKSGPVWHQSAEEATLARMPKYNAHACGTGAHGDAKYNRARQKRAWQKELNNEGLRNRGGLPLFATRPIGTNNHNDASFFAARSDNQIKPHLHASQTGSSMASLLTGNVHKGNRRLFHCDLMGVHRPSHQNRVNNPLKEPRHRQSIRDPAVLGRNDWPVPTEIGEKQ